MIKKVKKIKKIAILVIRPLDQRDYKRFGVEYFLSQGIEVTLIDASDILLPMIDHKRDQYLGYNHLRIFVVKNQIDEAKVEEIFKSNDLIINFEEPFLPRRGRVNCSLNDNGKWRWFGTQFIINNKLN